MGEPPTEKGHERLAQRAWRAFTEHFWSCGICRNRDSEWDGQFCPIGRELFVSTFLMDDDRERLAVWAALVRATPRNLFWKKAAAAAKSAGEFVAGIGAIVGVLYGPGQPCPQTSVPCS